MLILSLFGGIFPKSQHSEKWWTLDPYNPELLRKVENVISQHVLAACSGAAHPP